MFKTFIASQFKKPRGLFGIFSARIMVKSNQKNYDRMLRELNLQPQERLLEIGYGPGEGIRMIAENCPTCTIDGIDFSSLMYKRAAKLNGPSIAKGAVRLQHGDFLKAEIENASYDKVYCLNVVYFWNSLKEPFEKVFRLLKNGGAFYIYMANRDALIKQKAPDSVFNKYSVEQVIEVLQSVGFVEVTHFFEKGFYIKARKSA